MDVGIVVSRPGGGCGWWDGHGHGMVEGYASRTWYAGNQLSLEILPYTVGNVFAFPVNTQSGIPLLICILPILRTHAHINIATTP